MREKNGRYSPGTSGNPEGRKPRVVEESILDLFRKAVTPDVALAIIERAVQGALQGNPDDRNFLFSYLIGKPIQRSELSGADGGTILVDIFNKTVARVYDGN